MRDSPPRIQPGGLVVVTGASSGIGAALAEQWARRGHATVLVGRREDRLRALAAHLMGRYSMPAQPLVADLSRYEALRTLAEDLTRREVEVLCSNAGAAACGAVRAPDPVAHALLTLNVVAHQTLTDAVLGGMVTRGHGALVFTGSMAGRQPVPGAVAYGAAKAWVNSYAEGLHEELRGTGVGCTLLAPGPVRTEFYTPGQPGPRPTYGVFWEAPDHIATEAVEAVLAGRRVCAPGLWSSLHANAGGAIPHSVSTIILRRWVFPHLLGRRNEPSGAPDRKRQQT